MGGLVAAFLCPGPVSIILSVVGLVRAQRLHHRGRGYAVTALILNGLGLSLIALVTVVVATSAAHRDESGRISTAGTLAIEDLRTGDCLSDLPEGESSTVDAIPCAEAHGAQTVAKFVIPEGPFPGTETVKRLAEDGCADRLSSEVLDRVSGDELSLVYLYPRAGNWSQGDREVICVIASNDGTPLGNVLPTS